MASVSLQLLLAVVQIVRGIRAEPPQRARRFAAAALFAVAGGAILASANA